MTVWAKDVDVLAVPVGRHGRHVGAHRRAVIDHAPALHAVEQIELQIARLEKIGTGKRRTLLRFERMHQLRGDEHDQLLFGVRRAVEAEERADNGQITEERHARRVGAETVLDESGHGQGLPLAQLDGGHEHGAS